MWWFVKERYNNSIKKAMEQLRRHRGFNDCLTYAMALDDCTILHKDGAISRHFIYQAPDMEACSDAELDYHAQTWAQAFNFLSNGWMVEANVLNQSFQHTVQPKEYPELVSALFADERNLPLKQGFYFQTRYYLSITWRAEDKVASRLRCFAIEGESQEDDHSAYFAEFDKVVNDYIGFLKRSLISITPLADKQLTSFLYQSITGKQQDLVKPYEAAFLDCYLSSEDFIAGYKLQIGNQHIRVLTIDDLPPYSYPCICEELSFFPIEYRWSSRFICLDKLTARAYLKRYERSWSSKAIGLMGVIRESLGFAAKRDEDAQATADQLKAAQVENSAGNVGYGFYTSVLVLTHKDPQALDKITEAIQSRISQLDFRVRDESINATESYLGSIPCHGDYNLRKMLVETRFVGQAFPTSSVYPGESKAPCHLSGYKDQGALLIASTRGSRPFFLNLHVGDVGHTVILGPTGKGKSTLCATLMMAHRQYEGSRIIVLDKDYSNRLPIKALRGEYYDLAKGDCQFGVLARLSPHQPATIEQAIDWLKDCCAVYNVEITPTRQTLLRQAVERLAQESQAYKNLSHLHLQDPELREAIETFNAGQAARLLNGTDALSAKSDVIGFEMGSLVKPNQHAQDSAIPIIKAIFNELETLFQDKRPTLFILEEAWLYLRHALFREKLTDWFKTLRKANVSVIFVSQDLDDIVKSDAASVIQSSCLTRIYLPNSAANEPQIAKAYESFGLNEHQRQTLAQAIPKQDYYYQSEKGNRLFTLDLQALARAFVCVSSKTDLVQFETLYDSSNPRWVMDWLEVQGLSQWKDFVRENYFQEEKIDDQTPCVYCGIECRCFEY